LLTSSGPIITLLSMAVISIFIKRRD
jgi:hypothetical protein